MLMAQSGRYPGPRNPLTGMNSRLMRGAARLIVGAGRSRALQSGGPVMGKKRVIGLKKAMAFANSHGSIGECHSRP